MVENYPEIKKLIAILLCLISCIFLREMVFGILQYCCFDNQNYHCVFDDKTPVPKKCLKLAKTIHMTSFVTIATV